jgi:hypothetical protein
MKTNPKLNPIDNFGIQGCKYVGGILQKRIIFFGGSKVIEIGGALSLPLLKQKF